MSGFASALLSIAVIAALLLGGGGLWLVVRRKDVKRGVLMILAALVTLGNVLIWALPV